MSIHLYVNDVPDEVIEDSIPETSPTSTDRSVSNLAKASLDRSSSEDVEVSTLHSSSQKSTDSSETNGVSKKSPSPKVKTTTSGLGTGYYDTKVFTEKEVEHYKKRGLEPTFSESVKSLLSRIFN